MSKRLVLSGVRAGYGAADVLNGVDLTVEPGKLTVLLGPNGAGKSTLLRCVMGMLKLSGGTIELDGRRLDGQSSAKVARAGVALVPEARRLFGPEPVADNLLVGGWVRSGSKAELLTDREQMYERFPILGQRRKEPAASLSGGEAQMLAIAMALMARPQVLLLDEPSLGLAPRVVSEVMELAAGLAEQGSAVLLVEQMVSKALAVADWVAVLGRGAVVTAGTSEEVKADGAVAAAYLGVAAHG
ncbi:MAG TPA: ABC transporter ATP-binding protein [Frankiaceae bacterium]|jgi:branched-chain amino acid transport system ATP-binding protein|nr:ABC transporter ATP-binding protein [Frankiaceae bacterium]